MACLNAVTNISQQIKTKASTQFLKTIFQKPLYAPNFQCRRLACYPDSDTVYDNIPPPFNSGYQQCMTIALLNPGDRNPPNTARDFFQQRSRIAYYHFIVVLRNFADTWSIVKFVFIMRGNILEGKQTTKVSE